MNTLKNYSNFVESVTSEDSNNIDNFINRLQELKDSANKFDINLSLLNTCAIGLPSESGEFSEIVKKILFHKKELTIENIEKMEKELGDVAWYFVNACRALNKLPEEILNQNQEKLENRHSNGIFNPNYNS